MTTGKRTADGSFLLVVMFALCSLMTLPDRECAAWSDDPTVNTPVCTASDDQLVPTIIRDGSGGAIITWTDYRNSDSDISPSGSIHPVCLSGLRTAWPCARQAAPRTGRIWSPTVREEPLSPGGIIETTKGFFLSQGDVYVQRVNASGVPQWTSDGVAVCTAHNDQSSLDLISDGSGGAIISWADERNTCSNPLLPFCYNCDIYAQRVNSAGVSQWAPNGVAVCTANGDQSSLTLTGDASRGAIITWKDDRSSIEGVPNADIYAQRVPFPNDEQADILFLIVPVLSNAAKARSAERLQPYR